MVNDRRFPMPWRADEVPGDCNGQALPMLRTIGIARPFLRR